MNFCRNIFLNKIIFSTIKIILLVIGIYLSQVFVYMAINLEGNVIRLFSLFREIGIVRFLFVTVIYDIINALNFGNIYIWIMLIGVAIIQWILIKIPSWIALVSSVLVYLLILQHFSSISPITIVNNLTVFVAVANLLAVSVGIVIYIRSYVVDWKVQVISDVIFETYRDKRNILIQKWLIYRVSCILWTILLICLLYYQAMYFYISISLLSIVILQFVVIMIMLFKEPQYKNIEVRNSPEYSQFVPSFSNVWVYAVAVPLFATSPVLCMVFFPFEVFNWISVIIVLVFFCIVVWYILLCMANSNERIQQKDFYQTLILLETILLLFSTLLAGFSSITPFLFVSCKLLWNVYCMLKSKYYYSRNMKYIKE